MTPVQLFALAFQHNIHMICPTQNAHSFGRLNLLLFVDISLTQITTHNANFSLFFHSTEHSTVHFLSRKPLEDRALE